MWNQLYLIWNKIHWYTVIYRIHTDIIIQCNRCNNIYTRKPHTLYTTCNVCTKYPTLKPLKENFTKKDLDYINKQNNYV